MPDERLCPNCSQSLEPGAVYCGSCGFKLVSNSLAGPNPNTPAYAVPYTHHKQHWAVMALAFGLLGIGAGALVPIVGIGFGICGIVLITSSFRLTHGWLKPASLAVSTLAIVAGVGFWVNVVAHDPKLSSSSSSVGTSNGIATVSVSTPCYSLSFNSVLNVNNASGSCSMNAYNGPSLQDSSDVYKVVGSKSSSVNSSNFDSLSKQAIEADISKNLPGYTISNQSSNLFDGSPAYFIEANNTAENAALIEETILHVNNSSNSDNFFVILHAINGRSVDLSALEKTWQWND